ncbi:MAG: hypothetical protein DPW09_41460 [Anaerolineae bacterium]|nr:hypothetical protein [Anaerolineales bacterium]MCQ3979929.1 hypothetical protein [Anaerolineae bacterium]
MNVLRRVWLAGLALWLAGCAYASPEPPDPGQEVATAATNASNQKQVAVTKPGAEPTATAQVSTPCSKLA